MQDIAIVGAAGKMGSWFTSYFADRGLHISAYDVNRRGLKASANVSVAKNISSCVKDADFVLVCVPPQIAPNVIKECAKSMKGEAIISEISSIKSRTFRALEKTPTSVRPLCIHPMYGPGARAKMQIKVLMIPVRNKKAELRMLRGIFENAVVKVVPNAKAHDKWIATVLGVTYFVNIIFAKVVVECDISMLKEISGTTFGLQSLLAESVLTNEPDLVAALIQENPYTKKYIEQYLNEASAFTKLASAKDGDKLKADLKKIKAKLQKWQDLEESYRRMYEIIGNMK